MATTSGTGEDAPSQAPGLQRKKSRMSVMFDEMHHVPHDDEIGVETSWHDLHGGSFHRLSKKHKDHVHRRLSSMGPVAANPTDIKFPSCRLIFTALAFFGFLNIYCLRVNLSVALVAMTKSEHENVTENATDHCGKPIKAKGNETEEHEFEWTSSQQGIILAAFFYGYVTTQIPGGMLAERFGGKLPLLFGIFWTAVLTILTPVITHHGGFIGIVITRVLEGVGEGVTYPSMHAMLSKWAPPQERSKMVTCVYAGAQIGTVIAMPISGLLCQYINWDAVFYFFGALGVVWSVLWFFLTADSPAKHPRIDPKERDYIEQSQGLLAAVKKPRSVPWLSIAKSLPVWAVAIAHFTNNWGYYMLLTCLPTFLKKVLHFDMKSNGLLSGVPYLVMWMFMILSGFVADVVRSKHLLQTTNIRKVFNAVGFIGPAICLVVTGWIECDAAGAVTMIVIAVGVSGISMAGWAVNHLDLAPPFAGTLMGITNGIATIPGFVTPSVVGAFTEGEKGKTPAAWRNAFYVAAGVYLFGTIFYAIFGSGQRQPWALELSEPDKDDEEPAEAESSKKE